MEQWELRGWVEHTQVLLNSYRHWVGADLIDRSGSLSDQARRLYEAPCVVVSHGTQADPILNYGNRAALQLWETTVDAFCQMPSRLTAEPQHRDERARLLERTARDGFVDDYSGIRISSTGKRFFLPRATVWNLVNERGEKVGQAATFSDWKML